MHTHAHTPHNERYKQGYLKHRIVHLFVGGNHLLSYMLQAEPLNIRKARKIKLVVIKYVCVKLLCATFIFPLLSH